MPTFPILAVLAYDLIVFLGAIFRQGQSPQWRTTVFVDILFFFSGMPALVYQIVWQRALFAIYGVNAESVAVVVSAFMLGLGLGSLAGGWLSFRFPRQAILLFGLSELGVALFGLGSLHIFHWAASFTAGASLPSTIVFILFLLTFPTMLMGATLPILVAHLVRLTNQVGYSVARLYFMNTFGSAVACYLCAIFLLRDFGQSGSIMTAALTNVIVGATAFLFGRSKQIGSAAASVRLVPKNAQGLLLGMAALIAGVSGFIALGLEIEWFRVFALASSDRAPAFALLLTTYLAGIAAGSYISGQVAEHKSFATIRRSVGLLMTVAGAISVYLPPLVATLKWKNISFIFAAFALFVTAALLGSVFPLLCQLAVAVGDKTARGVSLIYFWNIIGSAMGSLLIGFVLMNRFGLQQVSLQLGAGAVFIGGAVLLVGSGAFSLREMSVGTLAVMLVSVAALLIAPWSYVKLFERLIFGNHADSVVPLAYILENRNGVIAVTRQAAVFGNGVYDGYFNVDPMNDVNLIVRAFALSAPHGAPKHALMIGLSSGSWAQIFANHPQMESLDVVEINPGYLQLIPQYPAVRSVLHNAKVHIHIDDGRRWLLAHPQARYDVIIENASFYWRDHASTLLSEDFLRLLRQHLNTGGIFYYNTTGSDDVVVTGLRVYPYDCGF